MRKGDVLLWTAMAVSLILFLPLGIFLMALVILRSIVMMFGLEEEKPQKQKKQKKYKEKEYSKELINEIKDPAHNCCFSDRTLTPCPARL